MPQRRDKAVCRNGFHASFAKVRAKNGSSAHREATMFKTKCFAFVASVSVVSFGSVTSWAQQPPPQSPDVTFFVTSIGPGKGADLGGLEGADRHCQTLAQGAGAGNKTCAPISAATLPCRAAPSTPATG